MKLRPRRNIHSHPSLDSMVQLYQQSRRLKSWSAAATELLVRGIEDWIRNDEADIQWPDNEALRAEYLEWLDAIYAEHGWDDLTILEDDQRDRTTFYRFMVGEVSPKNGGARTGGGRRKGSKNKPKPALVVQQVEEDDEIPEF